MNHSAIMMKCTIFTLLVSTFIVLSNALNPIDNNIYYQVTNAKGEVGSCRGNGGSKDKIDGKSKGQTTQSECEAECTSIGPTCVGYSFNANTNNGQCGIYGPGMDGSCSIAGKLVEVECGTCSVTSSSNQPTTTMNTCGSCTVDPFSGYANTQAMCLHRGIWTAGTWTAGTWSGPTGEWEGDSHHTTHIHSTDGTANHYCFEKDTRDHESKCDGNSGACQTGFEDLRTTADCPAGCTFTDRQATVPPLCDGTATDVEATPDCKAAFETAVNIESRCGAGCTFVSAPVMEATLKTSNMPPTKYDGWADEIRSWGDWDDVVGCTGDSSASCWNKHPGVCRVANTNKVNTIYKYSKTDTASNGMLVDNQEGCLQACLDAPTGTCVGYSYSESTRWCLVYGPEEGKDSSNVYTVANATDTWTSDGWFGVSNPQIPCVLPNIPEGCKTLDTTKPNPSYTCILLLTTTDRWKAYPTSTTIGYLMVRLTTSEVDSSKFTLATQTALEERMAEISFVVKDDVTLSLDSSDDGKIILQFIIKSTTTINRPMTKLLDYMVSAASKASAIFDAQLPGSTSITAGTSVTSGTWPTSSSELKDGEIAGIAVGCIIGFAIGIFITYYLMRQRTKRLEYTPNV